MEFDRNITSFPTMLHRDIYMTAVRYTPPDISLAEIAQTDLEMAESGRQYYAFMTELLYDMYQDPERYGMHPGALEKYLNGRTYNTLKRDHPPEARIYFDQAGAELGCYLNVIGGIAGCCELENGKGTISEETFENIISFSNVSSQQKERLIPSQTVLSMLAYHGLEFHRNNDGSVTVTSGKYPNMFKAVSALGKSIDESVRNPQSKALKYFFAWNGGYLEFRQILRNYKPTYEDYVRILPDSRREIMEAVRSMAKQYKMRETYERPFLIHYHYKSKRVMSVWTDDWLEPHGSEKQWRRNMSVRIWGSSRPEFLRNVENCGQDFVKYFRKHLNYCRACTRDHIVQPCFRMVLGKKVRICSDPGGIISNPGAEDLPYIQKYIDLKVADILDSLK